MKSYFLLIMFSTFIVLTSFSQSLTKKEMLSIIYLQSNIDIRDDIKSFFKKDLKKKDKCDLFYISPNIQYIKISNFKEDLINSSKDGLFLGINKDLLESSKQFDKEFGFKPFKKDALSNLIPKVGQKLKIRFSKSIGNVQPLEIVYSNSLDNAKINFGRTFQIIFIFDEDEKIIKVLSKTMIF